MYFKIEDEHYDKTINMSVGDHFDVDIDPNNHFLLLFISHTLYSIYHHLPSFGSRNLQEHTLN